MGEALSRHYLDHAGVEMKTASCGVLAWPDTEMTEDAQLVLKDAGINASAHRSQPISLDLVADANLVIAMTRDHALGVLSRHSPAKNYTFLTGELLRLIKQRPFSKKDGDLDGWISMLNEFRNRQTTPTAQARNTVLGLAGDEVADPAFGNLEDHRRVFNVVDELSRLLAQNLALLNE